MEAQTRESKKHCLAGSSTVVVRGKVLYSVGLMGNIMFLADKFQLSPSSQASWQL